jgi:hypothetical protein
MFQVIDEIPCPIASPEDVRQNALAFCGRDLRVPVRGGYGGLIATAQDGRRCSKNPIAGHVSHAFLSRVGF